MSNTFVMRPRTDIKLPPGWSLSEGGNQTQEEVDQLIDTYYRTGPGANLGAGDYSAHTALGAWDPAAASAGKQAFMEANPNFETTPYSTTPVIDQATINAIMGTARTGMQGAFTSYGADPKLYEKDIEDRLASILAGVPKGTKDYSTFFPADLGTKLIGELETGRRNRFTNEFSSVPTDFIPMTADDAFIDSLLGEQRSEADQFIQRMIDRGLMTETGATGARKDLDRQAGLGKTRLTEIGTGLIGTKESELDAERGKRLGSIGQLKLGDPFDVGAQKTDLNKLATDFIGTLGEGLKTGLGSEKLFDTSGLGAVAGRTGGAKQPTAGLPQDDEAEEVLKTGEEVLF